MADKEVTVKITTETDIEPLEELDDKIEELQEKGENMEMEMAVEDSEVDEATEKTEELESELETIDGMTVTPEVDTSSLEEAQASAEETASSMDSIATAAAGISATAGIEDMAATADRINTSWNRLELTFQGTGVSMDTLKAKTSELTAATGHSGSQVRDYFNQMGIAGITNVDLLSTSFENLSGRAYQTGTSIETMESAVQRMVMSGNAGARQLSRLGISSTALAEAMGVTKDQAAETFKALSESERLEVLNKAMGDGTQANEMYKNSYAGLKEQASIAMGGLMGAVGQAILPVVIPALQAATTAIQWLTDGFKSLPGPVQSIIGGIAGAVAIFTAFAGVLGIAGQVIGGLKAGIDIIKGLSSVSSILGTVRSTLTTINTALAASEWAALGPILLIVAAVVALIAVLAYLYFNNEQVRAAIDNLGQTVMNIAGIIWDTAVSAFNNVISAFENFWSYVISFGANLTTQVTTTITNIITGVTGFLTWWYTLPVKVAVAFTNIISRTISFAGSFVSNMVNAATRSVNNFMSWISSLPGKLLNELNRMLSYVSSWAATLPAKFWQAGVNAVKNFLSALGIASPGTMQRMMIWEVSEMARRVPIEGKELVSSIGSLGRSVVDEWDPSLGLDLSEVDTLGVTAQGTGVMAGSTININLEVGTVDSSDRVNEIVDVIRRELNWNNITAGRTI